MDILDEAKQEVQKEGFIRIYKSHGKYLVGLLLVTLIFLASYFWWQSYQENVILDEANEYNNVLSMNKKGMINKLENLKEKKGIYGALAQLQLAAIYIDEKDFNRAIHNYEQLVKRKSINNLYLDYAKLMLIKTKLVYGKITDEVAIKLFKEYLDDSGYFQNIARIAMSVLLVNQKGGKEEIFSELNLVMTDINTSEILINLAKIIRKRANKNLN